MTVEAIEKSEKLELVPLAIEENASDFVDEPVDLTPPKRKPGRPRKDGSENGSARAPNKPRAASVDVQSPRKKVASKKSPPVSSQQIRGLHEIVAMISGQQILRISDGEAEMLATALNDVAEQYDIALTGKTSAVLGLIAASVAVYGPRVVVLAQNSREKNKEAKANAAESVASPAENMAH